MSYRGISLTSLWIFQVNSFCELALNLSVNFLNILFTINVETKIRFRKLIFLLSSKNIHLMYITRIIVDGATSQLEILALEPVKAIHS